MKKTLLDKELYLMFKSTNAEMVLGWVQYFSDEGSWSIGKGSIVGYKADAVVSPANSYGFMDGGIDLVYRNFFGPVIQNRVQSAIKNLAGGKLEVGQALIVPTGGLRIPKMIVAPTMERPQDIRGTDNVYRAMKATLEKTLTYNKYQEDHGKEKIESVLVPGMGTGYGMMDPFESAEQMKKAVVDVRKDLRKHKNSLDYLLN